MNILPLSVFAALPRQSQEGGLKKTSSKLVMFNEAEVTPVGKKRLLIQNPANEHKYSIEVSLVRGNYRPLLGSAAIQQRMKLITVNKGNIQQAQTAEELRQVVQQVRDTVDIMHKYSDVFIGEGKLAGLLHLEVDDTIQPV